MELWYVHQFTAGYLIFEMRVAWTGSVES